MYSVCIRDLPESIPWFLFGLWVVGMVCHSDDAYIDEHIFGGNLLIPDISGVPYLTR